MDDSFELVSTVLIPDDLETIQSTAKKVALNCDLILTTGGTGFGSRDVTPEVVPVNFGN
jgi:molybdopterin adenylyltransferase